MAFPTFKSHHRVAFLLFYFIFLSFFRGSENEIRRIRDEKWETGGQYYKTFVMVSNWWNY